MEMESWLTRFETVRPMESLPRMRVVSVETRDDASYRYEGVSRGAERFMVFQLTLSGSGRFEDAKGVYELGPGKGFLCEVSDPSVRHWYPKGAREPWVFVFATFEGACAREILKETARRHGPVYELPSNSKLTRKLLSWKAYGGSTVRLSAPESAACAFEILTSLAGAKESEASVSASSRLVLSACDAIEESLCKGEGVSSIAKRLMVSREHLSRLFRREMGQSVQRYMAKRRFHLACHLLKETELGEKGICERLGGISPQHLIRVFKQELKITPRQFRASGACPPW